MPPCSTPHRAPRRLRPPVLAAALLALLALLALGLAPGAAHAQETWTLTLSRVGQELSHQPLDLGRGQLTGDTTLDIRCRAPVDCQHIEVYPVDASGLAGATLLPVQAQRRSARYRLSLADLQGMDSLALRHRPAPAKRILLRALADDLQGDSPPDIMNQATAISDNRPDATIGALLDTVCAELPAFRSYDRDAQRGEIVVTATGTVLTPWPDALDEDDTLIVTVLADARLAPLLEVRRTSAQRALGDIRILGDDIALPGLVRQSESDAAPRCAARSFPVGNFAPGQAEIELAVRTPEGRMRTGLLELRVHPLYSGMFSLGPLWSRVADPGFTLVPRGSDTVISTEEQGQSRMLFAFYYTPFVWGPRDIEKPVRAWYEHINPSVGMVLSEPLDHALAGLSVGARGFVLTAGVHLARVRVLDEESELERGDVFTGEEDELPVARAWELGPFVSVSVDLRTALKLAGSLLSSAAP